MNYSAERRADLKRACSRWVAGHPAPKPDEELRAIAGWMTANGYGVDYYGTGKLIADFEAKVAALLGKPAAVFMPSGKMASMIAIRIWADRAKNPRFGMHRTSHLELHEQQGYRHLHGLDAYFLGPPNLPILAKDFDDRSGPLSSAVLELPMREIGGQLPPWDDLLAQRKIAAERGFRLHMDGARLWEAKAFYEDKSYADMAALFDSVYVSFYKGIGGISGAMLLGEVDFIDEARVWLTRHGGTIYQQYPAVASAAMRFDERLARMPAYYHRAHSLAAALGGRDFPRVIPAVPQANMMHLAFPAPADLWEQARDLVAEQDGIWLGAPRSHAESAALEPATVEIYVGENLMALSNDEVISAYTKLMGLVRTS